jgi:L-malate glycosyltransferase
MKVLRIYTRLPPLSGGMENHIKQLTKEQIELGRDVTIYFNAGEKVTSRDVQVTRLPIYKLKPQFIGIIIFYCIALIKLLLNKEKFDIVHIHGDWSSLILSVVLNKIVSSKKLIFSMHDEISENFLSNKALSLFIDYTDLIFATGNRLAKQLRMMTNKSIIVQPSGIKKIFFEEKLRLFDNSSKQIIVVANLIKKKNLDLVLDIAKELMDLNFVIVGDGPKKEHLSSRINDEGICNVKILGKKNSTELLSLYYSSDIFLLTSAKEGTPTSMLEAMACGLPIVSSGAGGVESILGNLNYIIEENEKKNYVECISKLIMQNDEIKKISLSNMSLSKSYSWERVAKKIDDHIFENMLDD